MLRKSTLVSSSAVLNVLSMECRCAEEVEGPAALPAEASTGQAADVASSSTISRAMPHPTAVQASGRCTPVSGHFSPLIATCLQLCT